MPDAAADYVRDDLTGFGAAVDDFRAQLGEGVLMRWNQIIGHDVVDTSTAESLGTIDGCVVDPERSAVVAILVGHRAVSWSDADGIGEDALTLTGSDLLHDVGSDLERRAVRGSR